ncbi:MAG: LPS translocon maturation chaperone LptM [Cellvibrionaceae bacterium]
MKNLIALIFVSIVLCTACGQTGPLTLPLEAPSSDNSNTDKNSEKEPAKPTR